MVEEEDGESTAEKVGGFAGMMIGVMLVGGIFAVTAGFCWRLFCWAAWGTWP